MKRILVLITLLYLSLGHAQEKSYAFTLEDAINYAMTNSYAVRLADLDIDAAEKKKWETTAIGLPQIDADGTYSNFLKQGVTLIPSEIFGGPPGEFEEVVFGTKQNLTGTVTLNQLLFDGSYLIGLQAAETYLKISSLSKDKTNQTVREAVINAYGQVLITKENIRILETTGLYCKKILTKPKLSLRMA